MNSLHFENISFAFPGMSAPVFQDADIYFDKGWTGIVGPNGAGKTTLLRLASGELKPSSGKVHNIGKSKYAAQRTDSPPDNWIDFMESYDADSYEWRDALGVRDEWIDRWNTLSHGERKRAQIAAALWSSPDILALDEPTNHIDADARETLIRALEKYRGVGLLVSHDRELLDRICGKCLFINPPSLIMRPGGVSAGMSQDQIEQTSARNADNSARSAMSRLKSAAQKKREEAEQSAAKNKPALSKKPPVHDHDGRAKRQLAKLTGKDSWAVNQSAALAKRAGKAEESRAGLSIRKEYEMGFWLEGSEYSPRNFVLSAPATTIEIGTDRALEIPDINIGPRDRIALTGPNGAGKSTLIRYLLEHVNVPPEKLISVPQEISAEESASLLEETKKLPKEALGRVMTSVSRLGSRPGRLLESVMPSPGEVRKLLLALGVDRGPHLIIMDEPTNHMDLPSIECLEEALSECPCALLLVSHDRNFLEKLAATRWNISVSESVSKLHI